MGRHYIQFAPILQKKALVSMILSDRTDGKTTGLEKMGVQGFDADGKARVFSRRFSTEITNEFFDEVVKNLNNAAPELLEGRDFDFVKASKSHCAAMLLQPRDSDKKKKCFSFIPITQAGRLKSALGYETHKDIYFDEYIPLDDRYTKNEVTAILELYQTVDRKHDENRIIICGNKISPANPIFEYFGVTSWELGKINMYQGGEFALLLYSNKANRDDDKKRGKFETLVKGTKYEQYNAGGWQKSFDGVVLPTHSPLLIFRIAHGAKVYGVYQAGAAICIDYVKSDALPSVTVCVEQQPPELCAVWLPLAEYQAQLLRKYKYCNALFFASPLIAATLQPFYKKI